jgi:hypothetical protein
MDEAQNLYACQIISARDIDRVAAATVRAIERVRSGKDYEKMWRAAAVEALGTDRIEKCKCCGGGGYYVMEAGDGSWSCDCENCGKTGYTVRKGKS